MEKYLHISTKQLLNQMNKKRDVISTFEIGEISSSADILVVDETVSVRIRFSSKNRQLLIFRKKPSQGFCSKPTYQKAS